MSEVTQLPLQRAPEQLSARIGREIRGLMAREGVKQSDIAQLLHVPQSSVSARLRGVTPWDANELQSVAHRLGTSVAAIVADAERPRPVQPDGDNHSARPEGFEPPTF